MNGMWKASWLALILVIGVISNAEATDLSGQWAGRWNSFNTRHNGPLRCTLTKLDETRYQADFRGRFCKLIPFRYSVILHVVEEADVVTLSGQKYLGRRYGTFYYRAEVDETSFTASYTSCEDRGQFVMTRRCSSASSGK